MNLIRMMTLRRQNRRHRGQVLLMVTLMLPVLCGMMGLAIDLGYLFQLRRRMQTAADAGAMAAAHELKKGSWESEVKQAAREDVALNGFDGSHGEMIAVNRPPTGGPQAGDNDFVEVVITQDAPTFFIRVLGINSSTVQARAVGGLVGASSACIYVLDPTAEKAFEVSSGSRLNATCGVYVNSNHRFALSVLSDSHLTASTISVVGNYESTSGSTVTPDPDTGVSPEDDPLADLPPPTYGGCNFNQNPYKISSVVRTLNPGVYCGGISVESGGHAILNPGIYIIRGGGLRVSSGSVIEGNGVSIYNTTHPSYAYMPIDIDSNATAILTAPDSGPMAGILFFGDRNHNGPSDLTNYVRSNSISYFEGTLYFPTQRLEISSNTIVNDDAAWTMIVAQRLRVHSNTLFHVNGDYSASSTQPPKKKAALVE